MNIEVWIQCKQSDFKALTPLTSLKILPKMNADNLKTILHIPYCMITESPMSQKKKVVTNIHICIIHKMTFMLTSLHNPLMSDELNPPQQCKGCFGLKNRSMEPIKNPKWLHCEAYVREFWHVEVRRKSYLKRNEMKSLSLTNSCCELQGEGSTANSSCYWKIQ